MGDRGQPRPLRPLSATRRAAGRPGEARSFLEESAPRGFALGLHAFCKINLGLTVGPRRADGYHDIDTVFQTIEFADTLYARPRGRGLRLRVVKRGPARRAGLGVSRGAANLVLRAARRLRAETGERQGADIVLVKRVPAGSGLGGGSSDAAAALRLLQRLWGSRLGAGAERRLAGDLGSDCAFFLAGGRARATGRGERLRKLPVPRLESLVLALPRAGVSTALAYRLLDASREGGKGRRPPDTEVVGGRTTDRTAPPSRGANAFGSKHLTPPRSVRIIIARRTVRSAGRTARSLLGNDFEEVIARQYPDVHAAKQLLEELGVGIPRMSGSGSAVFGILPPGVRPSGVVTRWRLRSFEVVLARFTRVGSLWCR